MTSTGRLRPALSSRRDGGASALEFAILAPLLLVIIFFVIQVSLWYYGRSVALSAAREGVSRLRLYQSQPSSAELNDVEQNIRSYASGTGAGALNNGHLVVDPGYYDARAGTVTVRVEGSTISLVPFFTFTVSQRAIGRIEKFGNGG